MEQEEHDCKEEPLEIAPAGENILQDSQETMALVSFLFKSSLSVNLVELCKEVGMVGRKFSQPGQVLHAFLGLAVADEVLHCSFTSA